MHKFVHWVGHYTEKRPARERAARDFDKAVEAPDGGGLLGVLKTGVEENVTRHSEAVMERPGRLEDLREVVCSAPDTEVEIESEGAVPLSDALDYQFRDLRYLG